MPRCACISALCTLILFWTAACAPKPSAKPGSPAYRAQLLDSLFQSAVKQQEIPGAVVYISRGGKEVFHKAYGYRNIENKVPMQANDIFRIASMTKGLTAVAVLQLCERGLLFLDDPLSKYIPEFAQPQVLLSVLPDSGFTARPATSEITIRHLLTHTSGIGYGFQDERYNTLIIKGKISEGFEEDDRTSLENIRRLAKVPLLFDPGERYTYGMSFDVLGVVIEKVSGLRYDQYVSQYILAPLGMKDSYFVIPEPERARLVTPYQPTENGSGLVPITYSAAAYPTTPTRQYFSAGADLCSTAADYAKFIQMLHNQGIYQGVRILGKRYVALMLDQQMPSGEGDAYEGFAAWVTNEKGAAKGPMSEGAFGFGGFWDTYGWADPQGDFVAVLMLQMYPGNRHRMHEKFQAVAYGVVDELE